MAADQNYSWTGQFNKTWEIIRDDSFSMEQRATDAHVNEMLAMRRRFLESISHAQRGILRHLYIIIDLSMSMGSKDFKPSCLELTCQYLKQFVVEFYDQNPISMLGFIATKDGVAYKLSDLSGNPQLHISQLDSIMDSSMLKGYSSLVNSLELARVCLSHAPSHSSKEVLIVSASLTFCDPTDINSTIEKLKQERISCSSIFLSAEIYICKKLCNETGGTFRVVLNEDHFKTLLWEKLPPSVVKDKSKSSALVLMGFPRFLSKPSICACHNKITFAGYECPRCHSKQCFLPTDCSICDLKLISAPHLARSYHHLFPVLPFNETEILQDSLELCFACASEFLMAPTAKQGESSTKLLGYKCRKSVFCKCTIPNPLFTCPISKASRPPIAQRLHPSHISVVASMGDSITSGLMMRWKDYPWFPNHKVECRTHSYGNGAKINSVAKTVEKYSEKGVVGASCERSYSFGEDRAFNYAITAAFAKDLSAQAKRFVDDMNGKHRNVDERTWSIYRLLRKLKLIADLQNAYPPKRSYHDDWKLVNIWIGSLDICHATSLHVLEVQLRDAIEIIRRGTRRVFINLILNLDVADVYDVKGKNPVCKVVQKALKMCPPVFEKRMGKERARMHEMKTDVNQLLVDIAEEYAATKDPEFMVAAQAGVSTMKFPEYKAHEILSWFDCFHPNKCANEHIAMRVWNSMFTPIEQDLNADKTDSWHCPTSEDYFQ